MAAFGFDERTRRIDHPVGTNSSRLCPKPGHPGLREWLGELYHHVSELNPVKLYNFRGAAADQGHLDKIIKVEIIKCVRFKGCPECIVSNPALYVLQFPFQRVVS